MRTGFARTKHRPSGLWSRPMKFRSRPACELGLWLSLLEPHAPPTSPRRAADARLLARTHHPSRRSGSSQPHDDGVLSTILSLDAFPPILACGFVPALSPRSCQTARRHPSSRIARAAHHRVLDSHVDCDRSLIPTSIYTAPHSTAQCSVAGRHHVVPSYTRECAPSQLPQCGSAAHVCARTRRQRDAGDQHVAAGQRHLVALVPHGSLA